MTLYHFVTLSPKEIGKYLKEHNVNNYKDMPQSINEACKVLDLINDGTVTRWLTITRFGATEWYINVDIDTKSESGKINLEIQYYVTKTSVVTYTTIGGFHKDVLIYEKECPLFDGRPEHNNLKFYIYGKQFIQYENDRAIFDNKKPLQQYIETIISLTQKYQKYIKQIDEICFNGEYQNIYNKFNFEKFKNGGGILANEGAIGITSLINAACNAEDKFNIKLTVEEIMALYAYTMKHKRKIEEYYKNKEDNNITIPIKVNKLFFINETFNDINDKDVKQWIEIAYKECLDDEKQITWEKLYKKANKELHFAIEKIRQEIADKYQISTEYIVPLRYNEKKDECRWGMREIPEEGKILIDKLNNNS